MNNPRRKLFKAERIGDKYVFADDPRHSQHEEAKADWDGLSPRLGESEPVPREDDLERCDFGAAEIAELKSKLRVYRTALKQIAYPAQRPPNALTMKFRIWASSTASNALSFGYSSYVPPKEG